MGDIYKTIACFKELGLKPNLNDFTNKLILQKTVYILKKLGLNLKYSYGFHIRGPYSPDLTKELYANKNELEQLKTTVSLSEKEISHINRLKRWVELEKPSQMEIISTYIYLKDDLDLPENLAIKRLKELKPFYSDADIVIGITKAKGLLFKEDEATKKVKEEMKVWDKTSDELLTKV